MVKFFLSVKMLQIPVLLVLAVSLVAGALASFGPCYPNVKSEEPIDFDKFFLENNGSWVYQKVPGVPFFEDVVSFSLHMQPDETAGQYQAHSIYRKKEGMTDIFFNDTVSVHSNYLESIKAGAESRSEKKIYFLKYVPERYAYYYVCVEQEANETTDYRYVIVHDKLTPEEEAEINSLEKKFNLKGTLKDLLQQHPEEENHE